MIAVYLDAAFESGDLSRIAEALGDVARARGMTKIARTTGLAREQLYRTLSSKGKPERATVLKVMAASVADCDRISHSEAPNRHAGGIRPAGALSLPKPHSCGRCVVDQVNGLFRAKRSVETAGLNGYRCSVL
jgi:probable addiction module antidote protein